MWYKKSFFKYATGIILTLLIIFLLGQVDFILSPIKNAIVVIALPIIVSLLFYYLLRPLVRLLLKIGLNKVLSIIVSFIVVIGLIALFGILAGNIIVKEFNQLVKELPRVIGITEKTIADLISSGNLDILSSDEVIKRISGFMQNTLPTLGAGVFTGITSVVSTVTVLLLVPFIVFYFLKDDKMIVKKTVSLFNEKCRDETIDILKDVDNTLSSYITGQALVCVILGLLTYIGYLIIGLKYALILGIFTMLTAVIPYLGVVIGILPAILVGLSYDYFMIIKIIIIAIIVQNLEGNLVTPQIMGKTTHSHPVIIMIVFLVAASLFGFVGVILAVPAYALLKVLVKNAVEIYKILKNSAPHYKA